MLKKTSNPVLIFLLSLTVLIVFFVIHACRKLDRRSNLVIDQKERFFRTSASTNPTVAAIASKIKRQDARSNYVPYLIKHAGFPVWDKAKVTLGSNASARQAAEGVQEVFIPFVIDSLQQTKAILTVKLENGDTSFRMLYNTQYAQDGFDTSATPGIWSAQETFAAFTTFDYEIYGHKQFKVYDSRIFGTATDTTGSIPNIWTIENVSEQPQGRLSRLITIHITYIYCNICYARMSVDGPCCNPEYVQQAVMYWIEDPEFGPGGWWEEGGGGGGSCGDACSPCPGCDWSQTNPCEEQDPNAPQVPCDDQWQPVTNAVAEPFDPYKYDSIRVDNEILDSFPCVYQLLTQDLKEANKIVQLQYFNLFALSQKNHTYFKLRYSLCGTDTNATTQDPPIYRVIAGQVHFIDTIALNPCFLKNASKEAIAGVILHEMIHAYINYCFNEYRGGRMDSTYLIQHFPLHWQKFKGRAFDHTNDHEIMANTYIDSMARVIFQLSDTAAPLALRQWVTKEIAKGGLSETSAWGSHSSLLDTCTIAAVEFWSQHMKITSGGIALPGCTLTYPNFRDSLQLTPIDSCH